MAEHKIINNNGFILSKITPIFTENTNTHVKSFVFVISHNVFSEIKTMFTTNNDYNVNIDPYEKFNSTFLNVIMFKFLPENSIIETACRDMNFSLLNTLKNNLSCQGIINSRLIDTSLQAFNKLILYRSDSEYVNHLSFNSDFLNFPETRKHTTKISFFGDQNCLDNTRNRAV